MNRLQLHDGARDSLVCEQVNSPTDTLLSSMQGRSFCYSSGPPVVSLGELEV